VMLATTNQMMRPVSNERSIRRSAKRITGLDTALS
jgi:hypothetical protein